MGVTRFESIVSAQSVGTQDVDKLAASFERLAGTIEASGKKADKVAEHPGFDAFAGKVKAGIEDPLGAAAEAMDKVLKAAGPMGAAVGAGIGIFSAVAVAGFEAAHSLAEYGTQIANISLRTGLTTKEVGQFSFAAKAAGQDVGVIETAMRKLSQGLDDASEEGKKARTGLSDIGVAAVDSNGKLRPMSDIFLQISEGLKAIEDPAKRNTEAIRIFGRAGIELLPTIIGLTENIARAKELGLGPSEENVARWEGYHKQIAEAEVRWSRLARTVKEPLASVFTIVFRGATGDVSDIAQQAAEEFKKEIAKLAPEEAQRRLDLLKQSGVLAGATIADLQGKINQGADKNLFAPQKQWQQTGVNVLGFQAPGPLRVDLTNLTREIDAALGGAGDKGLLEDAHKKLGALQDKLRADQQLKAPVTQLIEQAGEVEKQKGVIAAIEARIKATEKLAETEKLLEAFEREADQKGLGVVEKAFARRDDLIKKGADAERAGTAARLLASTELQKIDEEQYKKEVETENKYARLVSEREARTQKEVTDADAAAAKVAADFIKTSETVARVSEQMQIARLSASSAQRINFLGLAAGPGQDVALVNAVYRERLDLAKQLYAVESAVADRLKTADEQRIAHANAYGDLVNAVLQAQMEQELRIGELQRKRLDDLRNLSGQFFDSLLRGRAGIEDFLKGLATGWAKTIFENVAVELLKGQSGHLTLPGQGTAAAPTWLGKALAGTPPGIDPLKDAAATKLSTAGVELSTAAAELMGAARSLAVSSSGGGGGRVAGGVGIFTEGEGLEGHGLPTEGSPGDWAGEYTGGGFGARRALGIGGAAAAGGFGIYSGVRSGGAKGVLTATGSALAMSGAILSLASKALKIAGPIGEIAGIGLGLATLFLPDPKAQRDKEESARLDAARFTGSVSSAYTRDRYGRDYDTDVSGGLRPIVNVNVNAIDTKSFQDHSDAILDAVTVGLEARRSPRASRALRNTVMGR